MSAMDISHSSIQIEQAKATLVSSRNDLIDAFADLEAIVARILRSAGHQPKGEPFCQRVKQFRGLDKSPLIAKANFGARNQIADGILALLPVRADIVHSRLDIHMIDGQAVAILTNANEAGSDYPTSRMLTVSQFRELIARVALYTKRIAALGRTRPEPALPDQFPGEPGDASQDN